MERISCLISRVVRARARADPRSIAVPGIKYVMYRSAHARPTAWHFHKSQLLGILLVADSGGGGGIEGVVS